ncbi:hypothetical protein VR20_138 [Escherichia phage vB_EcoM_VR20]|uniref:Host specificity protein n=4 Tax=Gaprivervirus TaxID=1913654 RepID=A0A0A7HG39_9CAUD|nr:hypothetical protein SP18_gp145 [Shigella phage SP18]YP_009207317.1 hypothetical protein AVV68_gp138 [Escherichia phage vB_EcoM_VR20]YP_009209888.1 hypothetical protein AVV67_gp146 [Escherichia phage vB_EcoM_VR25]YP_009213977.1 hypothetical protein AVV66_gp140 [Escherichia phage vB_EcoM_VR26]ADO19487.1 hypothetical protein SP18gp145 [Shigella phage SP18]AIZ02196.1 hypothetical protein VR20_138 [Escherichia phage vB_EcoM_VR20]AIZ02490.1 hypothetical protein VR25_146 [Escherichia phage vB_Ec
MNTLKKLVEFIRSKLGTAMAQNLSIEDQYTKAASTLIDKITELQTAHVKSVNEEKRIRELANEKDQLAASKEREIRKLIADGADVQVHAKLGLLYRRTAKQLRKKADDYVEMRNEIKLKVKELDDSRQELAVKLEYIRETRKVSALGIATADDVVEIAALTKIDIEDTLMRVETFKGPQVGVDTTSADIEEYINSLK